MDCWIIYVADSWIGKIGCDSGCDSLPHSVAAALQATFQQQQIDGKNLLEIDIEWMWNALCCAGLTGEDATATAETLIAMRNSDKRL